MLNSSRGPPSGTLNEVGSPSGSGPSRIAFKWCPQDGQVAILTIINGYNGAKILCADKDTSVPYNWMCRRHRKSSPWFHHSIVIPFVELWFLLHLMSNERDYRCIWCQAIGSRCSHAICRIAGSTGSKAILLLHRGYFMAQQWNWNSDTIRGITGLKNSP